MADARGREQWKHTSSLMALIANCNRDPKKTPTAYKPSDFDPYHVKKSPPMRVGVGSLKGIFVDQKPASADEPIIIRRSVNGSG